MAEFVMKSLTDEIDIESRATSTWEHGNPIHRGTQKIFQQYHIPYDSKKKSTPISQEDFYHFDYLIGMDRQNIRDLKAMIPLDCQDKIVAFDTEDVLDPYYTGRFEDTYQQIQKGCQNWLEKLKS